MINLNSAPNGLSASAQDAEGLSFLSSSVSTAGSTAASTGRGPGGSIPQSLDYSSSAVPSFLQRWFAGAKNPTVCFFHLFFKAAALAVYIAGGWLLIFLKDGEIFVFVATLVLLVLDFWTVKNVSGRILIGMRWWSSVDAEGNNQWIFERAQDGREINTVEWRVFWLGNYAWVCVWLTLAVMKLLEFQLFWLLLCVVGLTLATTNVMAYRRCSASGDSGQNSSFALFSSFSEVPKAAGSAAEGVKNWLAAQAGTAAVQNVLGRVGLGGTGQRGAGGGFGY
ncbi:putative transmembrane protein [Toxoplasma gondii GAB2-2007-GAL-DOM2]|uniref:Golgi apparatus membrane protein TVP23 homolog n=5 Tax=Toxoplasma gondii TaxID=5811 RepID=B9QH99_TOXGV|nr:putative transmembrane protein [Toxoplasma gondii VEG]KFG36363.1 putative transmembrane protein [Toxoplasma gondii p89]KFG41511.1 putative transmembrane protein [Toxoplasma gondii GAB2-2007-GAL-DOM2]CEL71907.1 TPA: hypothetical protein BN1205_052360 [Toxoplasma gondii VEG]